MSVQNSHSQSNQNVAISNRVDKARGSDSVCSFSVEVFEVKNCGANYLPTCKLLNLSKPNQINISTPGWVLVIHA